ncbi:TasA family protein [Brevibacillus sp. NRS-1366]|uniref:TasA family protein n=1 Tax=Brevibacillus sp. NRS-1366 TaxID=3233899 RepID=UPI003D1EE077
MNLKKQFALTLASVGLGAALIGGGTFAYFSDQEEANNTFAAGTLDLAVNPEVVFDVANMKPGDWADRWYNITNSGSLDIKNVYLTTSYGVTDANNNNGNEDLGKHMVVELMDNFEQGKRVILRETIYDLSQKQGTDRPDLLKAYNEATGQSLASDEVNNIAVRIIFVDNGEDQNIFQGDGLQMKWTFDATQTAGEHINQ